MHFQRAPVVLQDGARYLYSATIREAHGVTAVLRDFFGGSPRPMMTALVTEASSTEEDLDALKYEIDRVARRPAVRSKCW